MKTFNYKWLQVKGQECTFNLQPYNARSAQPFN